jgi:hypothetical protein
VVLAMTALAMAVDALFRDPNIAADALWRPGGTEPGLPVRVIRNSPDKIVGFGEGRAVMPSVLIDVRQSEVALPAIGDTVEIAGVIFEVTAEPVADTLNLVWTCEAARRD